ncbi:MAG: hypothetical protein P9L96_05310 [Candidatus Gygaella obscura]|nr:hypothetical protein [Candidatus Gygaella obscura]
MRLNNSDKKIIEDFIQEIDLWQLFIFGSSVEKKEFIAKSKILKKKKIIKSPKVLLNYQKIGYDYNVLVAWRMDRLDGSFLRDKLKDVKNVTHCVVRKAQQDFDFNLFTMVHAKSKKELENTITMLKNIFRAESYEVMVTLKELIKRPFRV